MKNGMMTMLNNKFLLKKSLNILLPLVFILSIVFSYALFANPKITYETNSTVEIKLLENNMTSEELVEYFEDFWEDTYDTNIKPSNKAFYQRFNRAYYWWGKRARDSEDDMAVLEASKPHLLASLFLDYSPDNFNDDIGKWAANGDLDNIYLNDEDYAYQVCDNYTNSNGILQNTANCDSDSLEDNDYNSFNLINVIAKTIADAVAKAQKYLDDKDTIRALGRHLFVYQPTCNLTKTLSSGETEVVPYKYPNTYSFDEILELIAQIQSIRDILNLFPEYQDCIGLNSHWRKANGGEFTSTEFELNDVVDLCSFYKHLVESDYFENHVHFKSDFNSIRKSTKTDNEYLIEASKLKVGLAREIIDIVDLANTDDPVYDTSVSSAGGAYGSYSLSEDLYITLSNTRTDSSGYEIKDGSFPIDQYVEGVLDAEVLGAFYGTGETDNVIYTALQANAIAIRTYALKVTKEGTKSIANSTANQVFTDKFLASEESKYLSARNAALSTSGQVLTEDGSLIMSEYSSFSKKSGYYCSGDLCYTTYLKIGAKNSGTSHTVVAKKNWGLAGGHNRGMSQWGSLYLAANGYTYQEILANFYSENVIISNYDYSYKSTDNVSIGDYGTKEAMLVCQLFTDSKYANIRDSLKGNTTLEIPLRLTSTKYQSSHGYNASDEANGIWFERFTGVHGQVFKCDWDPSTTAVLYRCFGDKGFITSEENYAKDPNGSGKYTNQEGVAVDNIDPSDRVRLNVSETGTDVYLPSAIVWQWAINTLGSSSGFNIPTEGGWSAHGYVEAVSGFYPSYVFGVLPDSMTYDPEVVGSKVKTEVTSTETTYSCVNEDYKLVGQECCLIKNLTKCDPATPSSNTTNAIVYKTTTTTDSVNKSYRYDAMLKGGYEEMDYSDVLYTGLTDAEAIALSTGDGSDFYNASHVDTYLYMYVDDYTTLDPALQQYYAKTVTNIVQPGSSELNYGSTLRKADISVVAASGTTATSGFVNITEFLEAHGFVNIGGIASKSYSSLESHHWQLACDYSSSVDLSTLATDYCCDGLTKRSTQYSNYESGKSYLTVSKELGEDFSDGNFSGAWKIEFCTNTIEGQRLVKEACKIAFTTQDSCLNQCKDYETTSDGKPRLDESGKQKWHFDYKKVAKGCQYNPAQFGGSTSVLRNIGKDGKCSCAFLKEEDNNGATE